MEKFYLMKMFRRVSVYIIFFSMLMSCQPVLNNSNATTYFDLKAYFESVVQADESLKKKNVEKVLIIDGKESERIQMQDYNVMDDLEILKSANINRPAWLDKYEVDTAEYSTGNYFISYQAKEEDLKIQQVSVKRTGQTITEIRVKKQIESVIANSYQTILYIPNKKYSVETRQQILKGEEAVSMVEVNFIK